MLDARKLTAIERHVLVRALNMYCDKQVSRLVEGESWGPVLAAAVNSAEHLIDVIEETMQ